MRKTIFLMLGMAAMLASCSQDELDAAQGGGTAVITATVDDGIMTRASYDSDEGIDISRCLLEVRNAEGTLVGTQHTMTEGADGTFTCIVRGLDPNTDYTYVFWADDGASYTATDLTNVTIAIPDLTNALAFSGTTTGKPGDVSATLTHAVAKVTLKTTGSLDAGDRVQMIMRHPQTLNVLKNEVSAETSIGYEKNIGEDIPAEGDELKTIYVPAPAGGQTTDVRIDYIPKGGSIANSKTVTNVPLQANYRTLISGDIGNIGATDMTASLTTDWKDNDTQEFVRYEINLETAGTLTEEMIDKAIEQNAGRIVIKGKVNQQDMKNLFDRCQDLEAFGKSSASSIDMSGATLDDEHTGFDYLFSHQLNTIESLALPVGVKSMPIGCGEYPNLKTVELPSTLEWIGENAFASANLQGNIVIPESVIYIGKNAFYNSGITSIVWNTDYPLPAKAFSSGNLSTVEINGDVPSLDVDITNANQNLKTVTFTSVTAVPELAGNNFNRWGQVKIYVPADLLEAFKAAEGWSDYADNIFPIE